jgi:predicted nucleic acid-binding protein
MPGYMLDSDAVIDCLLNIPASVALIQMLTEEGHELCTCDVVLAEVYSGVRPEEASAAQAFLDTLTFIASTAEVGRQAGSWRYQYARQGTTLSTADMLIAATAHANNMTIVTRNTIHYPIAQLSLLPLPWRERGG